MKGIYRWLFQSYTLILILFVIIQGVLIGVGMRLAVSMYNRQIVSNLGTTALQILLNPNNPDILSLDYATPFFVFRADGTLAYTNRGQGRSIESNLRHPVYMNNRIIGYWYAAETQFQDRRENQLFLIALGIMAGVSLVISGFVAGIASFVSTRKLSGYLSEIQTDIHSIDGKHPVENRGHPISELRDISSAINSISLRLMEEDEYKRQWMQDLSHDLRTPVAGLRSQLEAMRDGVLTADSERLGRNLAEVERLETMIADINDLFTLESSRELRAGLIPAGELLEGIGARFSIRMEDAGLELVTSLDEAVPQAVMPPDGPDASLPATPADAAVRADGDLLFRALSNLLENALRYSRGDTAVELSIRPSGGGAGRIVCRNVPARLNRDELPLLFNRFHRGEFARNTPGTGLGLNIVREIVHRHSGSIGLNLDDEGRFVVKIDLPGAEGALPGES